MPTLTTDDPSLAGYFREVWLGAKGFMRWPVDARFGMWGLFAALWPTSFVVLWLVIPRIAFLVVGLLAFVRWVRRNNPTRVRAAWILGAVMAVLILTLAPLLSWVEPLPWYVAGLAAPGVGAYLTSRIAPYVSKNIPLAYRLRVLRLAASRPRRTRDVATIEATDELLVVGDGIDLDVIRRPKLSLIKEV